MRARRPPVRKRQPQRRRQTTLLIGLILSLSLAGIIFARWRSISSLPAHLSPAPQASPTPVLSKEYIYAGGRLIATEEPTFGGPAPTGLMATATSGTSVALTWTAPPTGSIASYQVERSQSINGPFSTLSPNPTTTSFTDSTATNGIAYLYRVRAIYTTGGYSDYSNKDLATTIIFTDDPLIVAGTRVKSLHVTELRQAVEAVRSTAALSPASWTDPAPSGIQIKAVHLQELRTSLDQARSALGLTATSYTDPTLMAGTTRIKKAHFDELRQGVK